MAPPSRPSTIVLCVSGDPLIREEASFGFPSGTEILLARDAREAMGSMKDVTPDVVVVDIQSGSAGGFSLAREMSQTARLADVPILMLLERMQDEWLARQAGAARSALKPIDTEEFVELTLGLIPAAA